MTRNQTHFLLAFLIVLAIGLTSNPAVTHDASISSDLANSDSSMDKSNSTSNLIYHTKMIALESLSLSKRSINIVIDAIIEAL